MGYCGQCGFRFLTGSYLEEARHELVHAEWERTGAKARQPYLERDDS